MDELARIRRFALIAAVLLLLYSAAGVQVIESGNLAPLGVPVRVLNPSIIVWGLVILSLVGLIRFLYYGLMLHRSPYRVRREILHALHAEDGMGVYRGSVFFGPDRFSTTPLTNDRSDVEVEVSRLLDAFPGFGTRRPKANIKPVHLTDDDGEPYTTWEAEIEIPRVSRLAAALQDIDYTAPVWANLLALGVTGARVLF